MTFVAGVDGCKAGWIVVVRNLTTRTWEMELCSYFENVVNLLPKPRIFAVDMPIGLLLNPAFGGRCCDQEARRLLGWPRRNSVFSPPSRSSLSKTTFSSAKQQNHPAGLTCQAFALFSKLREVEAAVNSRLQNQFVEVHPELCFYAAENNLPMRYRKKSGQGRQERINVLGRLYGQGWNQWWNAASRKFPRRQVALDDILDASIAAWTAERIIAGKAVRVPNNPPVDAHGLRMEIWY